ncbi:beta-propeller fold lactonase family protein [Candidatus Marsarchaeota archaeon]|nr:beta-propeller fold lactonase family protein [Candidatus Marsarchaeota archaeon]
MKTVFSLVFVILAIAMLSMTNISFGAALTATPSPFSLSNTTIDVGQISIANTLISGGIGPYNGSYSFMSSNSAGNNLVSNITVGANPQDVAFSPSGAFAYVADGNNNEVSVIDTATNTVTDTISVGSSPEGVAFSPSGAFAYVTNEGGTVSVIDTATNTVTNTISVGSNPEGVAFSPSGAFAYVADGNNNEVSVIDTATNTVTDTISVGSYPRDVAFSPSGTLAYVTNYGSGTVNVIDTATNETTGAITVGANPRDVAFSPSGTLAYVTDSSNNEVSVIDTATNTVTDTISVGSYPIGVAFNPSGTFAYVANDGIGTVSVIDTATNTVTNTITVGLSPYDIAFNPSGTFAYVTQYASDINNINVVDTAETSMQLLHSSNALTMIIDAVSSNTIALTFNGVQSQFSTGSSTVYGAWTFYGYAQDSTTGLAGITGLTGTNTITTSNTLTINPALAISLSPSSNTLDAKQQLPLTATVSGGTPSFTLSYTTSNSICGSLSSTSNTLSDDGANTIVFTANSALTGSCATTITASVKDSATSPITETASSSLTVNPVPTATSFTPSNTAINSEQYVTYNVIINGGTLPITANLVLVSNSIPIQINGANAIPGTTYNTIVLNAGSAEPNTITFNSLQLNTPITSGGNVTFTVNAVDSESTPVTFNSVADTIIINAVVVPHHSGSTGPPKYTFTLSDNINSTLTSAYGVYTIYASSGNISYYQNQLPVTLSLLTPYLNVSWACNVSISANTYTYQNDVYGLGLGIPCGKYYTTYTPNLEVIYSLSAPTKINVTTTSTTTILPTPPTPPANKSNKSITLNGSISSSSPFKINFTNMHVVVVLTSPSPVPMLASASITNETSMVLPSIANYTPISKLNVNVTTIANVSVEITSLYPCSVGSSIIKPFELVNGSWSAIIPFSVNTSACTVSFVVPKDPIVAIFQKIVPTTTVTTTINTTTTIVPTTTAPQTQANTAARAVVVIVIVIILLVLAYYYMSKAGKHGRR